MKDNIFQSTIFVLIWFMSVASCGASSSAISSNHLFDHVEIAYTHDECSFQYSPVNFCDERHLFEIKNAITAAAVNFNKHYILLKIKEWRPAEYYGNSVVVIDTQTGIVYPMPFDYYSGEINMQNSKVKKNPKLTFSSMSNWVCVRGAILVYRATVNGNFCFDFDGVKFTGYRTEYMN